MLTPTRPTDTSRFGPSKDHAPTQVFAMIETREAIQNLDSILDLEVDPSLGLCWRVRDWTGPSLVPATSPSPSESPQTWGFPGTQRLLPPYRRCLADHIMPCTRCWTAAGAGTSWVSSTVETRPEHAPASTRSTWCFLHSALVFKARGQCDHQASPWHNLSMHIVEDNLSLIHI